MTSGSPAAPLLLLPFIMADAVVCGTGAVTSSAPF